MKAIFARSVTTYILLIATLASSETIFEFPPIYITPGPSPEVEESGGNCVGLGCDVTRNAEDQDVGADEHLTYGEIFAALSDPAGNNGQSGQGPLANRGTGSGNSGLGALLVSALAGGVGRAPQYSFADGGEIPVIYDLSNLTHQNTLSGQQKRSAVEQYGEVKGTETSAIRDAIRDHADDFNQQLEELRGYPLEDDDVDCEDNPESCQFSEYDAHDEDSERLEDVKAYHREVSDFLASYTGPGKPQKEKALDASEDYIDAARESFDRGETEDGNVELDIAEAVLDFALSWAPGLSFGKDVYEAVTGENLVTGETLDSFDRGMAIFGVMTGGIGSRIGGAVKGVRVANAVRRANKGSESADAGADVANSARKTGAESPEDVKNILDNMPCDNGCDSSPEELLDDAAEIADAGNLNSKDELVGLLESAQNMGMSKTDDLTNFAKTQDKIAQTQNRHIKGRQEYRGGGYMESAEDAQKVLTNYKSGNVEYLGTKPNGSIVIRDNTVTGTDVNTGVSSSTNVFIIKGTSKPSVVPTNPDFQFPG